MRERQRQTDRQTDREGKKGINMCRKNSRMKGIEMYRKTDRLIDISADG